MEAEFVRRHAATSILATMVTQEGKSPIGGMIERPPIERDMDMPEAGEAAGMVSAMPGKTSRVLFFMAAREQCDLSMYGKRVRSETSESASAPVDWRSRMERTMRQQALKVMQLHQTIDRIARMLEAHAVREEAQSHGMKEWLQDSETKRDEHHSDDVLWGTGIMELTANVLAKQK